MMKHLLRGVAVAAMTVAASTTLAQDSTNPDQSQYPTILEQPIDQCLLLGSSVTFSVVATNVDTYQWYKNNVAIDGETNSSLTIANLGTDDAAYYVVSVIKDSEVVPSRSALLNVYLIRGSTSTANSTPAKRTTSKLSLSGGATMSAMDAGGGVVVFSPPVAGNGTNACCGAYSGYVNYLKTPSQGWGYYADTNTTYHAASDYNRSDTKVSYTGSLLDGNCNQTSIVVPNPTFSPKYRFTIFFPRNVQVPTNSYPITLDGFLP